LITNQRTIEIFLDFAEFRIEYWEGRRETSMSEEPTIKTSTIAETSNYLAWKAEEADGESTYHLELGSVTVHFFLEEWQEFLDLAKILSG
jgi:hypothetical protein